MQLSSAAFPEVDILVNLVTMEEDKDAVSAMQESVDQLALSMFDSLRLIPFSEVKGVVPQQGAESVVIRRAVATGTAWHNQVQALAEGVLTQARSLDGLIDVLPGAELREDQQMEVSCAKDQQIKGCVAFAGSRARATYEGITGTPAGADAWYWYPVQVQVSYTSSYSIVVPLLCVL